MRAFGSSEPLPDDALRATGPPRYPRPSRLGTPLEVEPAPAAKGAERLGLVTVGDLLEHLPRDRQAARTIAELIPEETATVVAEVRSIASRSVRRRGMRPLVEAVVADATGTMKATFFNQPWLERKYRPGTRLLLQGKYQARNRFRVSFHAPTGEAVGSSDGEMATYPATEGLSSTQILALARQWRGAALESLEPLPARLRALERLPDRAAALDAAHFGDHEGGRRRLAFEELLLLQVALLRRRARRREGARADALEPPGELTRRWLAESLPFAPTGDQRTAMATVDEDLGRDRPMQRLLMGEVGSGKTVVALYAMLRAVEQGAQAALMAPTETLAEQHFATHRPARQARHWRAAAAGRDARADRAGGRVRAPRGRRRRRAAPLRRQSAPRARPQGAGLAVATRAAHDRDADPAHARADRVRRPRRDRAARAPRGPAADRHLRGLERARARAGLRAHPRGAARGPPGLRRLPAGGGVRGAPGARRDRRVRAPAGHGAARLPRRAAARAEA